MPNLLQQQGAMSEPSSFAPIHTNRLFTGLWTNRSVLRDAATSEYLERSGMGRQDALLGGYNSEISTRLTLRRRPGNAAWSAQPFYQPKRWYSFNTFDLADENIHVMLDEPGAVYDTVDGSQKNLLWTKSAGALSTYFLGVGNTLYFTNGVDNKQWILGRGVFGMGIPGPTTKPSVVQQPRANPYTGRNPNIGYASWIDVSPAGALDKTYFNAIVIRGSDGNLQQWPVNPLASDPPATGTQTLGYNEPAWAGPGGSTLDGTAVWLNKGSGAWATGFGYGIGDVVIGQRSGFPDQLFVCIHGGNANGSGQPPTWPQTVGQQISEGNNGLVWQNAGILRAWGDFGVYQNPQQVSTASVVVDDNGNLQKIFQMGKSSTSISVAWQTERGALTTDNTAVWLNAGNFSQAATGVIRYGYAYQDSTNKDLSNMSPPSDPIIVNLGNSVVVQGVGSGNSQVDIIPIYRLAQGGSTYLLRATIPNPGAGITWTYIDNDITDTALDPAIQAQVVGEGTPLPTGATCLGYHLGRILAAVGNVVYVSAGADAIASGTSGNVGFNTTFTAQSKIIRFWTCSLGIVVFTVRDAYIILGSATANDPLYMVVFIEQLPLLNYDAFTVNKTTPYMLLGNKMLVALDPSAGITEVGFPIADRLRDEYNPKTAYVTFHSESSEETALYVGNANGQWYRMNQNNAPEQGSAWSTKAMIANCGALQSVEVSPGTWRLLWGPASGSQQIMARDATRFTDNGAPYPVSSVMGSIVLALPGQLAELFFITLESVRVGTRAGLALLLGEISGTFEPLKRTRQDPPNLPPSETLFSDRYHFMQNQKAAWCRHFQMEISWPAEDAPNELLTFTIFGQTWQEMRSQ